MNTYFLTPLLIYTWKGKHREYQNKPFVVSLSNHNGFELSYAAPMIDNNTADLT